MERLICCGMCTRLLAKSYHFNPPTAGDDYAITAHDLTSRYINLNGNPVTVKDGVLPTLTPQSVTASAAGAYVPCVKAVKKFQSNVTNKSCDNRSRCVGSIVPLSVSSDQFFSGAMKFVSCLTRWVYWAPMRCSPPIWCYLMKHWLKHAV
eukprot:m.1521347 g.1521347  ORF g.1521347 m.1521347 type:complete len:150 (-) comp25229_c0_seq26:59-508(-)